MTKKIHIKKRWLIIGGIIIAIILVIVWFANQEPQPTYSTVAIKQGELRQTVSETGTVKPLKELNLNFPQSGKIAKIAAKIGDKVVKDQVLAELDYSSLLIKEQEAQANLDLATANREKLLKGATGSDKAVLEAQVRQAKSAYEGAASDYDKTLKTVAEATSQAEKRVSDLADTSDATPTALEQAVAIAQLNLASGRTSYEQARDNASNNFLTGASYNITVANTALDKIAGVLDDDDLDDVLSVKNTVYKPATENSYNLAKSLRTAAETALAASKSTATEANFNILNTAAAAYLNATFQSLNSCYSALENTIVSASLTQTELDVFKTSVSAQITAVNAGISSLQAAKYSSDSAFLAYKTNISSLSEALRQAEVNLSEGKLAAANALSSAKLSGERQIAAASAAMDGAKEAWGVADRQLAKLKAPARSEDITLAEAQIRQAQASLDLIRKQSADSLLKAPIDGQIVALNYEAGEQFAGAKPVFVMLTENNYEIEVDVSETDISKIMVGNETEITFDALGESHKFSGRVFSIEPSATIIQGVIYYKLKISLTAPLAGEADAVLFAAIKPEMTANVTIDTAQREDVLIAPNRAIIDKNGSGKFIRILSGTVVREVPVAVGLVGDEGLVEVTGDIQAGELAVTFIQTAAK